MTRDEGTLGGLDGTYITRQWGVRVIKCTNCDWSERATSRPEYAHVLMVGHDADHAAELAQSKARKRDEVSELEFDRDLAWLMVAESQYQIEHGEGSSPDELDRLASTSRDPVNLASFLAMTVSSLAHDTAAKMQLEMEAVRAPAGEVDSERDTVIAQQDNLAWQMVADWQQIPNSHGDGPGKLRLMASGVYGKRYVAMYLAGIAASLAVDTVASMKQKIEANHARRNDEFLAAVRSTNLGFEDVPDSELLERGQWFCETYLSDGDAGIEEALDFIYTRRGPGGGDMMRAVATAARQHLCS